ncbi:MAG: 2-oxoacid:acceptor oxidoreductase family protein [Firmicutes bacterium]|nr:2-oxoacid:acceptor oxidoreductase family protein [Bacillota bacterium]
MVSIRWHGRGGQGAKTASQLLAVAFLKAGRYPLAFPEYGPERTGAPVVAYTRVDSRPIRVRSAIDKPDIAVVLDASLLAEVRVANGLSEEAWLIVNREAGDPPMNFAGTLWNIPADQIARDVGARFANTVLVGTVAGLIGEPSLAQMREALNEVMGRLRPQALDGAWKALEAGYMVAEGGRHRVVS